MEKAKIERRFSQVIGVGKIYFSKGAMLHYIEKEKKRKGRRKRGKG